MQNPSADSSLALKQLVLVGGGHSHLQVITSLGMRPIPGLRVVLVSQGTMTGYSGMLPGLISGHYDFEQTHIDLRRLCAWAGVVFIEDSVKGLDTAASEVATRAHGRLHYDWLSINIGSTPDRSAISGDIDRLIPVKPLDVFLRQLERIEGRVLADGAPLRIGVIGAGAAGVEVLLAMQYRFARRGRADIEFHLFSADAILPTHNARVRGYFQRHLAAQGVVVHDGFEVVAIEGGALVSAAGETVVIDEPVLTTSAAAQTWPAKADFQVDECGFIEVNEYLQSCSHGNIFAAGDIAAFKPCPTEKAGVFAVRHGKPLAENLRRCIEGRRLKPYRPQKQWLALLARGDKYAVASRGRFFAHGRWVWRWKDHIDRRFMRMFQQLPRMAEAETPRYAGELAAGNEGLIATLGMRCAGCGAKVGSDVLTQVLDRLGETTGNSIGQRDDAVLVAPPPGQLLLQSLDYFTALVDDPWELGRIAANHALGDIYAMGGQPHSALALASLPHGNSRLMAETLRLMLEGAVSIFEPCGVRLLGGHSSEAAQLSLGFSVNGFGRADALLYKRGMQPGDRLVMLRPIGTGVLFAAHQRAQAKGVWLEAAIAGMTTPDREAAEILRRHGATACTDITGFGLLGHLLEMVRASEVDLWLNLDAVPLLPGVMELSATGIRSSLFPANSKARHAIANLDEAHRHPAFELLFDPQTAGGLLASVPGRRAGACLDALRAHYPEAAIVGEVVAGYTPDRPIRFRS